MPPFRTFRAVAVLVFVALGVATAAPVAAQTSETETDVPAGDVLARVSGETITRAEVAEAAAEALDTIRFELLRCQAEADKGRHEALNDTARNIVRDRILEREAAARDLTKDELLRQEVEQNVAEVTQEDVDSFYEENRERIGERPLEQVRPQIELFIRQQRETGAYERFISRLEEKYEVSYALKPYRVDLDLEAEPFRGPEDAPVTIVEFSDFECPFCARVVPTLERIEETYGERVRIVFKQFPLRDIHPHAQTAAEASLCAHDQGKFWALHDAMFADQGALEAEDLRAKAGEAGLDVDAFGACLEAGRHAAAVEKDLREGTIAGVSGTPALFVNGRLLPGAAPYEQLSELIEEELARKDP